MDLDPSHAFGLSAALALAPGLALGGTLAAASVTDLGSRRIPNRLTLASAVTAVAIACATAPAELPSRLAAAAGALALLGVPALVRPEAMGMGDAKLTAVIGLYLGPEATATTLASGCLLALVAGTAAALRRRRPPLGATVPLAPFLAAGAAIAQILQ